MIKGNILEAVGNTPLVSIKLADYSNVNLVAKLEAYNPTGSVKDRAASYILQQLLSTKTINSETTIIESTSGNFGVALSAYCYYHGLKFIAVVDPLITTMNEMLIKSQGGGMIKVTEPDEYGGYLLSRIKKIKELQAEIKNSYWINQYENQLNSRAYDSLGDEICFQMEKIDYVFLGVSSGGTIAGISNRIKQRFPKAKIIAVDVEGSMIFTGFSKKRFIPGIGSSMVPKILESALIDEVVLTDEVSTIKECKELLEKQSMFFGGSSGTVLAGIKKYFLNAELKSPVNVVTVLPDRGERYFDTIYNEEWCLKLSQFKQEEKSLLTSQLYK